MSARAKNKFKSAAVTLVLAGLGVAALALAYFYATPKSFRATARIKLEKRDWVHGRSGEDAQNPYDPHLAPSECQVLRSNLFFDRVATNLDLAQVWAKRDGQGTPLSTEQTRARLYSKTDIRPVPSSTVLQISVTSENADETAKIANEFARLYMDYRQSQRGDTIHDKLDSLQQRWQIQNKKLQDAQLNLQKIRFEIANSRTNNAVYYDSDNYDALQSKRTEMDTQTVQLRDQLKQLKTLPASELPNVLSSLDSDTNSPLNRSLIQLRNAKNDLAVIETDHGPETPEFKHANTLADELDKRVASEAGAVITAKEAELASCEAALKTLDDELKNVKPASEGASFLLQNTTYSNAYQELQQAQTDRDALQDKLNDESLKEAIKPVVITAELVDQADVPTKPFVPDRKVFLGVMGSGGMLSLAGLGLFMLVLRAENKARKK